MSKDFKKLPGVFAFSRAMVVSDALMFNILKDGSEKPVDVVRHGIAGTQNVDPDKESANEEERLIQKTESAKLDLNAKALSIEFNFKCSSLKNTLHSCSGISSSEVRKSVEYFHELAVPSVGIQQLALRYARNIANARWTWRNRSISRSVKVSVFDLDTNVKIADFDASSIPLHEFSGYSKEEEAVASRLLDNLTGKSNSGLLVKALVDFGIQGAVEVFPSQNYVDGKPKGFSRSLYKLGRPEPDDPIAGTRVIGQAAIRDQKISNAIRTIDTWYPDFNQVGIAIPVEPNGASLEYDTFFRKAESSSAFDLMKKLNSIDPDSEEGMFVLACMIRGGVYSQSDKAAKAAATAAAKAAKEAEAADKAAKKAAEEAKEKLEAE